MGSYHPILAAAAVVAGVVLVVGCSNDDSDGDANPPATTTPPATPTTSGAPTEAPQGVQQITVNIANGEITPPPDRIEVDEGVVVRIVVTSDQADELHVHGYDREARIAAGSATTVEFTADQTGLFAVELHELDKVLFQLQVQ